jgi:hypothetical protein
MDAKMTLVEMGELIAGAEADEELAFICDSLPVIT